MRRLFSVGLMLTVLLTAGNAVAAVESLVVGGEQRPWSQHGKITAFDEVSGALQSREYMPYQNIFQTLDKRYVDGSVLWYDRYAAQRHEVMYDFVLGEDPWSSEGGVGKDYTKFLDGDPNTGPTNTRAGATYFSSMYTFGTGAAVRGNRFVFYPIQEGILPETGIPTREYYHRGYQASASAKQPTELLDWDKAAIYVAGQPYDPLDVLLREEAHNYESTVVIPFPLQALRIFQLQNLSLAGYLLGEVELYGEGFAPESWYTSEIFDLNAPMNLGRVFWNFKRFRQRKQWQWTGPTSSEELRLKTQAAPEFWEVIGGDSQPIEWSQAPVSMSLELRTGTDDTPDVYHMMDELGNEVVVTEQQYNRLSLRPRTVTKQNPIMPGMQASVTHDYEHWTVWMPITSSGIDFSTPGPQRYAQFRVIVRSDDPWAFGSLDSLWVEYSPPLAKQIVAEVCVEGEPKPATAITKVEAGQPVTFLYALKASFDSPAQGGFDAVRISVPGKTKFRQLWMGEPLQPIPPARVEEGDTQLEIYLPRKVTRTNPEPVRLSFESAVLSYGTQFAGEVWDTGSGNLPQRISSGDATDEINSNQLQVLVSETSLEHLIGVEAAPNVITPNNDGINDSAQITHTLALVAGTVQVKIGIYDLSGRRVRLLVQRQEESTYAQQDPWNGQNDDGELVSPGVYLCRIQATTDTGIFEEVRPITVIY